MKIPNDALLTRSKTTMLVCTLLASMILNLFLVGIFAGGMHKPPHHGFGMMALGDPHGEYLSDWMMHHLDDKDAKIFHDVLQTQEAALRKAHDNVHQAMKDASQTFEQDPPDSVAMQACLQRLNQAKSELDGIITQITEDAYSKLSPDGRHRLTELAQ